VIAALVFAALAAAGLWALHLNTRTYVERAEAHWPPLGEFHDIEGAAIHVATRGPPDAPRILLSHGASANLRELWTPLADPLSADHRVIAFDRPGYGHSARLKHAEALALQARIAAGVLDLHGQAPALVIAHSLGAAVALRLAMDFPDRVRALILLAPASHPYPGKNVWWARLAAAPLIGAAFAHFFIPLLGPLRVGAGIANTFAPAAPPKGYFDDAGVGLSMRPAAFRASARDVVASKPEFIAQAPGYVDIMAPAIIISGEKDRVVSPRIHARALAYEMPAAELVTAPGAGHMPHRIRPDLVLAAVRRAESMAEADAGV
jgi:pimeloyl-ACP methyl ester carboxylesterase